MLVDRNTGDEYTPLKRLDNGQARFLVYDSLLSEFAAMGFEYGYSVARPDALVMWEAQFGDFADGAQTIIDEFISSGEQKWGQQSSVVLLLPHGYEGQGPDHSSARIERFLSLCAQDNMTVALPTTPANYFHLLRWQALSGRHKPLIVFTPKSMLRLKAATSATADFTSGAFQPLIGEPRASTRGRVRRVVLCTGKVYYDLAEHRAKAGAHGHRDRPGRAALPDPGARSCRPSCPATRPTPSWSGRRRSRRTRAPGRGWRCGCRSSRPPAAAVALPASSAPAFGSAKVHTATHRELIETAIPRQCLKMTVEDAKSSNQNGHF